MATDWDQQRLAFDGRIVGAEFESTDCWFRPHWRGADRPAPSMWRIERGGERQIGQREADQDGGRQRQQR